MRDREILVSIWFVLLPALLFGVLNVLAPLRLDVLGLSALAIGFTWLVSASFEALLAPAVGRISDRRGRIVPLRVGLVGAAATTAVLPWINRGWLMAAFVVLAACAFGTFWTPAMSMVADQAEAIGLDYAYGFALINLAWAPGAAVGAALGGAAARATSDATVYLTLSGLCLVSILMLAPRLREPAPSAST